MIGLKLNSTCFFVINLNFYRWKVKMIELNCKSKSMFFKIK